MSWRKEWNFQEEEEEQEQDENEDEKEGGFIFHWVKETLIKHEI